MPDQRIILTALPNGFTDDGQQARISVLVSPRLMGGTRLDEFPDFERWTRLLRTGGLDLGLRIDAHDVTVTVPVTHLRMDLWEEIFTPDARVDSYEFDDYTDRLVVSYPHQQALTTLKSLYQISSVLLAIPERGQDGGPGGRRQLLARLLEGLAVNWSDRQAIAERSQLRDEQRSGRTPFEPRSGPIGGDGLPTSMEMPQASQTAVIARRFALYHHMPPAEHMTRPAMEEVLDFHRVMTALTAYPALLRALGLVLDVTVDRDDVPVTPPGQRREIAVTAFSRGQPWAIAPELTAPRTAYRHLEGPPALFAMPSRTGPEHGLLPLQANQFGLAQVDVDSGINKVMMLAESIATLQTPPHTEVLDTSATLPTLRSGGLALVANDRARELIVSFGEAKDFNALIEGGAPLPRPFFAEDLVRGYRLDVWDAERGAWHSLHRRNGTYRFGEDGLLVYQTTDEEGYTQLAVATPARDAVANNPNDLFLHEVVARWAGWSLSAPRPGKNISRSPDPDKVIPPDDPSDPDFDPENAPATPFKMQASFRVVPGSLPRLRYGRRYRLRARLVDLAGNSLGHDDPAAAEMADDLAAPADPDGFAYLRYEPVGEPELVLRDPAGVTGPGSTIDRLVIRSHNSDPSLDGIAPDLTASDRHVSPPRASVELAERHGLFDDPVSDQVMADATTHALIAQRDAGQFATVTLPVAGQSQTMPLEPAAQIADLPYLPDPLARGAALRDLPGAPIPGIGRLQPSGTTEALTYALLPDANPRPGSATLIDFAAAGDWQAVRPFRLALDEGDGPPHWEAAGRVLTVYLPKAAMVTVPLSSYVGTDDLKLLGVWQWLREAIDAVGRQQATAGNQFPFTADNVVQIVQRATEGGHWMLTPPRLLTLVHAVQQPVGRPAFTALLSRHPGSNGSVQGLDMMGPTAGAAFDQITGWRALGALDAYLIGGLRVHGASTVKVDLLADWTDPIDDPAAPEPGTQRQSWRADELPLHEHRSGLLFAGSGPTSRAVGYYDKGHDTIWFARRGDRLGDIPESELGMASIAAPLHHFGDTKHHVVQYRAVATSRFQEYFPPGGTLDFTRTSDSVTVNIPASARPAPPRIVKVLPTFGWDRQTATNLKSSVRFGRGIRIYLERSWDSSGPGELLGVTLWTGQSPPTNAERDAWKMVISQWGADPIWDTAGVPFVPSADRHSFPDGVAFERDLRLDATIKLGEHGPLMQAVADVAGHEVHFDRDQGLWYCDISFSLEAYTPFVRLALARYQPHALDDAKLSRVVLADFVQVAPDRAAVVTADPYHPRRLRLTISGVAPRGPVRTLVTVTVQQRDPAIESDLAWSDARAGAVQVVRESVTPQPDSALWIGTVEFAAAPPAGQFRLLIREYEFIEADPGVTTGVEFRPIRGRPIPGRLIYADAIVVDSALIAEPPDAAATGAGGGNPPG